MARERKPTPRTVSIQRGRRASAGAGDVDVDRLGGPYQFVCQTSSSSRCRLTAAPGSRRARPAGRTPSASARARGRRASRGVRARRPRAHRPAGDRRRRRRAARRVTARIRAISSRNPYGLTSSRRRRSRDRRPVASSPRAVTTMIGTRERARSCRQTSRPSMSGRRRSSRTRSAGEASRAPSPVATANVVASRRSPPRAGRQ